LQTLSNRPIPVPANVLCLPTEFSTAHDYSEVFRAGQFKNSTTGPSRALSATLPGYNRAP
jgi:hypothetical protein